MRISEKYIKMHSDLLDSCNAKGIKVFPGKIPAHEILNNTVIYGAKDFFLLSHDMNTFLSECVAELDKEGYKIQVMNGNSGRVCSIYRTDILATTIYKIMTDSGDGHCPKIVIREVLSRENGCYLTVNKKTLCIEADTFTGADALDYRGSTVYAKLDLVYYLKSIYGDEYQMSNAFAGYTIFNENCTPEELINAVKQMGYTSNEKVRRYKQHRKWRREMRNPIEKEYSEYVKVLLDLDLN